MNATQENIREYQKILPRIKGKLLSAAMMFIIATITMTSATYAWITLSVAPEVTGISTTIAGNGNLEIALSPTDGSAPAESTAVDGSLSLVEKNVTWGNLVNLTDSSYGLQDIVLRPAALQSTLTAPLTTATYTEDGRIEGATSAFYYANYVENTGDFYIPIATDGESINYGLRPITSSVLELGGSEAAIYQQELAATSYLSVAQGIVNSNMLGNDEGFDAIATLMGDYISKLVSGGNSSDVTVSAKTLVSINVLLVDMEEVLDYIGLAVQEVVHFERLNDDYFNVESKLTIAELLEFTEADMETYGIDSDCLAEYQYILSVWNSDEVASQRAFVASQGSSGKSTTYDKIETLIDAIADVGSIEVNGGSTVDELIVKAGEDITSMSGYLSGVNGVIQNGLLNDIDQMLGIQIYKGGLSTYVSYSLYGQTVNATIATNVKAPFTFSTDIEAVQPEYDGSPTVDLTYAMAVDLWVRTNVADSYLVLEGEPIYEIEVVELTDANGNPYDADGDGVNETEEIKTVVGYQGVNRVWEGNSYLQDGSTTQGTGSSFVVDVDADNRDQTFKILAGIKIGLFHQNGSQLGIAKLDVDNAYEDGSRLTVPIVMDKGGTDVILEGEDGTEETVLAITALTQNEATMITALIYLDGTVVGNDSAISTLDLQGTLSLQFGSTVELVAQEDEDLLNEYLTVTASITGEDEFEYEDVEDDGTWTTTVQVVTSGTADPTSITGNFDRMISSTQGSKQETFTFIQSTENPDIWEYEATFSSPGTYTLSYIQVDDVNTDLQESATVTINGIAVSSVSWTAVATGDDVNKTEVYTADSQYSRGLNVTLGSNEDVSSVVLSLYHTESGNRKTVTLTKQSDGETWYGLSTFTATGTYTLDRITINGDTYELDSKFQRELTVYLGLYVRTTADPQMFEFEGATEITVTAQVYDSTGKQVESLQGLDSTVKLTYNHNSLSAYNTTATMTWNDTEQRYEGEFTITSDGVYSFGSMSIDGHTIQKTDSTSPTVTAYNTTPPAYDSNTTAATIIAPNNDASFTVYLSNASAATATASVTSETGVTRTVTGYATGVAIPSATDSSVTLTEYAFDVPVIDGKQDGTWQMTSITMSSGVHNVTTDLTSYNIKTTVVSSINVELSLSQTEATSTFMTATSVTPTVTVLDAYDDEIELVTGVSVTYYFDSSNLESSSNTIDINYDSSTRAKTNSGVVTEYGDYYYMDTSAFYNNTALRTTYTPSTTITLTDDDKDGDGVYTLPDISFLGAGTYYPVVTVTTTAGNFTYAASEIKNNSNMLTSTGAITTMWDTSYTELTSDNADSMHVNWYSPQFKFTAPYNTSVTNENGTYTNTYSNDGYDVEVHFSGTSVCSQWTHSVNSATLTLYSSTIGTNYTSAVLSFPNYQYASSGTDTIYTFGTSSSNQTQTEDIGNISSLARRALGSNNYESAVTITYNSTTFVLPLYHELKVDNPN